MCIDMSRLIPAGSVALLLNSAYLVAAPSASIWYYLQVGLHPLLGITLALALVPRRFRRERTTGPLAATGLGTLAVGLLLGLTVVVLGATRQYAVVLHAHIAASTLGAALLLAHVWRTTTGTTRRIWTVRAGLIALVAAGVATPMLRATRDAEWQQAYRIENPTRPPASMAEEGAGQASPFAPSSATTNKMPSRHLRSMEQLGPPLLVVQQPVVSPVDRIHAGRGRHDAVEVVRRLS